MKIFNGKKWVTLGGGGADGDGIYKIGGFTDTKIEIYDINDELIGEISRDVAQHSVLEAGSVYASNIVQFTDNSTLYIDAVNGSDVTGDGSEINPFKSINEGISSLKKYVSKNLAIYIKPGTYNENVNISGFSGIATININLENVILNGFINCRNNTTPLYFTCNDSVLNHSGSTDYTFVIDATTFARIERLKIYGITNKSLFGVHSFRGSNLVMVNCDISNFSLSTGAAIYASNGGKVIALTTKGKNNAVGMYSILGSTIHHEVSSPQATLQTKTATGGVITGDSPMTEDSSTSNQVVESKVKSYSAKFYKTWRVVDNWRTGLWQGNFTGKSGYNCYGVIGFDFSTLRNDLAGKTIKSVSIELQRKNEGGYDINVNPRLYATTSSGTGTSAPALTKSYGELPTFTKGLKKTVTLSNTIISDILSNTSIKSLMLYQPDGKHYSLWEHNITLNVTYQEPLKTIEDIPAVIPEY